MNKEIIPEITTEVNVLKEVLNRELPAGCKIKIPPFNRKCLRVIKSFCIVSEVHVRPGKILTHSAVPLYAALATLFCLPFGIYLIFKMKEGEAFRSSVHDIILRATRRQ